MSIIFNIHLTKQTIMKDSIQNSNNSDRHENAYAVYQKKDSVLYITFKKQAVLNYYAAKKVVKDAEQAGVQSLPALVQTATYCISISVLR